ncbi:hypothetical protein [Butyrivibrio proteoclasticus]|uniref:hypothetical protein n=1 Tax=Butyrivibrio proteoclasticus TaxID=43305 RepID=UPI00047876AE|nr:hypothetical protein [Butyrivibrio proteoclasticus]
MDDEIRAQLRKYNSNISISGVFIILYSLWIAIKFYLSIAFGPESFRDYFEMSESEYQEARFILIFVFGFFLFIAILFHVRIGLGGIRFGQLYASSSSSLLGKKGKIKKKGFIIWAIIYFVLTVMSLPSDFIGLRDIDTIDTAIATLILDITLSFLLFDMIYSAYKVIKINNQLKEG